MSRNIADGLVRRLTEDTDYCGVVVTDPIANDEELMARLRAVVVIDPGETIMADMGDGPKPMHSGTITQCRNPDGPEAADRIAQLKAQVAERDGALRSSRAWVFECWGWLMETDLDMTCPMQTDPLDIVEQIDAILGIDAALTNEKESRL